MRKVIKGDIRDVQGGSELFRGKDAHETKQTNKTKCKAEEYRNYKGFNLAL